ncbi:MAG: serine/threonine protein kinase, partial [Deltaproteobacteria bacterium]|nr:serine/threonine protein kinase [Deltaproteobacteria bacterium]
EVLEGKYELRRQIGEGGMGVVYEGRHVDLEMRVAIKVLLPFEGDDEDMRTRFKVEARSSASIKHPNVVEVHDFGFTPDGRPFFVMEYLEGESLADLLDRRKVLKQVRVVEILDQVLSGLARAHKKNIIHRDLKPENIFLSKTEDGEEVVKILDFGIAKILNDNNAPRNTGPNVRPKRSGPTTRFKTELGVVMGTPGYMAPEALTGQGKVDHRVDLFAVGILVFEMLTGRQPFRGKTAHEIMVNTATQPVPKIRAINPHVTREMEQLCLIALSKDPDNRFENATEFIEYLTAAAVGKLPANGRQCTTAVEVPSIIPDTVRVLEENRRLDNDVDDEPSGEKSLDLDLRHMDQPQRLGGYSSSLGMPPPLDSSASRTAWSLQTSPQTMPRWQPQAPGAYTGPARRRRSEFSFSHVKILLGLGIVGTAAYLIWNSTMFTQTVSKDPGYAIHGSVHDKAPVLSDNEPLPTTVTIWFDMSPSDAEIRWNGQLMPERPLRIPVSNLPAKVELTKSGYKRKIMVVTPNQEKTVHATLQPEK